MGPEGRTLTGPAGPAFYARRSGGLRDYVNLMHPPYTAWHLSFVVVGGCLAPVVSWPRLAWTVVAFGLAMGIGAHALDELNGRPLRTTIPSWLLVGLAVASVAAACAIGVAVAVGFSLWILPLVAAGAVLVPAYNLELFGGRLHTDLWFALAWGAFPALTGYVACAGHPSGAAVLAAAWATGMALAQRGLSTEARRARRSVVSVSGTVTLADGTSEPVTRETLRRAPEAALRLLAWSSVLLAATLVAARI